MKILFWVPYPSEGASNRYRIEQYLPFLKKNGIDYCLHPFWSIPAFRILYKKGYVLRKIWFFILGTISRLFDLFLISRFDLVFIHREAYPLGGALFEKSLHLMKKKYIFDFDDAIFLPASSPTNNFIERFKDFKKVKEIIRMSEQVIAGNGYLADFATKFNESVAILPTSIDTDYFTPSSRKYTSDKITIGWTGSVTTSLFLNPMNNVFPILSNRFPNLRFKIIGGNFKVPGLENIENQAWDLSEERNALSTFDIGIMPMPDNEWTRGKCGFKAILYMSMGVACVCSPVGMNKKIIQDNENGFFADNQAQWIEKISLLIRDPDLRKKISLAGRQTVENKYSLKVNAPKFLNILRKVYLKDK